MQTIGQIGETLAARYLAKKGYTIIERNYIYRNRQGPQKGEVDIVARKNGVIHFVEVKTSLTQKAISRETSFPPEARVSPQKQMRIYGAVQKWFIRHRIPLESRWQIDVVAVRIVERGKRNAHIRFFPAIAPVG